MTDRELLKAAAKAAGIYYWIDADAVVTHGDTPGSTREWNPITDDGDALRLAVRLQFDVCQQIQTNDPVTPAGCVVVAPGGHTCFEPNNADTYAATRRAIVRAAAEIGRSKT